MKQSVPFIGALGTVLVLFLTFPVFSQLNNKKPDNVQNAEIVEHLGKQIPLNLRFETAEGDSVILADLLQDDKPVILNPVYYECPMLCSMVTDAIFAGIKNLAWSPGKEFNIVTFSIDPEEKRKLAAEAKKSYVDRLDKSRNDLERGWQFLTGGKNEIKSLTEAVGFQYEKIDRTGEYAHTAAVMFLSPEGVITRYLYGIKFSEFNIRNALYEAADGNIGNTLEKVVMYCYQYDPASQSYVPVAWRIMQLGGLVTFVILGIFLGFMWLREKKSGNDKNLNLTNGSS